MEFFGGKVADDTYWEWVPRHSTGLKASTAPGNQLPDSDRFIVPQGAKMRAKLLGEDVAYWKVGDATVNGEPVPPHINLAYKRHWNAPSECAPPGIEDPPEGAGHAPPEPPPEIPPPRDKRAEPVTNLWQRLFGRRS